MTPDSRRQARLWLALIFILGIAIGGAFGYAFAHRSYAASVPPQSLSEPERRARRVAQMTSELSLTAEQAQRIDAIIHEKHDQMKVVHDNADKSVEDLRQQARAQMRALLTPEQLPKFEEFVHKLDVERARQAATPK